MGLSNGLSCETWNFSCHLNHHRFLQPVVLRLYFPVLETWVAWFVLLPSCSSQLICMWMWNILVFQPLPHPLRSAASHSPAAHPVLPSTSLDECFFFNSLVVGLPCSLIFWQLWLVFVFNLVVILLLVMQGSEAYLPMPPSWLKLLKGGDLIFNPPALCSSPYECELQQSCLAQHESLSC